MLSLDIDIKQLIQNDEFNHHSQTIYNINNMEKMGREFLFRGKEGNPESIFKRAKEENMLYQLDTASISKASYTYLSSNQPLTEELLFINIYPSTILHPQFPAFIEVLLNYLPDSSQHTVFEIVESEKVENTKLLKERVLFLKKLGYQIAIDDLGQGWASLSAMIELQPHYLKLDRYFSLNLPKSSQKQRLILLFLHYFYGTDTKIILEGVETKEELYIARTLGVQLCQGYYLSRPQPIMDTSNKIVKGG